MAELSIDTDALERKLNEYPDEAEKRLGNAVEATARKVQDSARKYAPVDTSNLQSSITVETDGLEGEVFTTLEYARYQEFGFSDTQDVKAHTRTITQAFGEPITPKSVDVKAHKRTVDYEGHHYMQKGADENKDRFKEEVAAAIKNTGKDIST